MIITLLALHGAVGIGMVATGRRLGRWAFAIAAIAPLAMLAWLATRMSRTLDGRVESQSWEWVPALGVDAAFRLDGFAALMVLIVSGIGLVVLAYSWHYFAPDDPGLGRLAGLLTLFAGAMLAIVLADDLVTLFTGWELTSITSYLLIGNEHDKTQARAAALHALLVTSAGGLVMLAGIVLIGQAAGTFRLSELLGDPPSGTTVSVGLVCIAVGAFTKSAQYPFHAWLPGAMAAPTPVSAYLHSATMVKAGVVLLGRFAPAFASVAPWRPLVLAVGAFTMVVAALRALRQYDLKLLLAHGTVSQLGFLVVLFGSGIPAATTAGIVAIVAHAVFKATLFLVVGIVEHQAGTRDVRLMTPLGPAWLVVKAVLVVAAASMAGIPLCAGFVSKELALSAIDGASFAGHGVVLGAVVAGSALTAGYSARLVWGLLVLPGRLRAGTEEVTVPHPEQDREPAAIGPSAPAAGFVTPVIVLSAATVVLGVWPSLIDRLAGAAASSLAPGASAHLALWHGVNAPLLLTALALAAGGAVFAGRRWIARLLRLGEAIPSGTDVYLGALHGLNRLANRITALVQNGTLTIYVGIVLVTAAVLPGVVLLTSATWPGWPELMGRPAQVPITVVLTAGALAAALVRRRFTAVLFLSTVGYGMAALFVVQGAPDLALTQAAVETVTTVLFVLVLRKLPDRFEKRSSPLTRTLRCAISLAVAAFVFAFAIVARESRVADPVSDQMLERALPDGKGRNVVNVILTDFRGFDTMGEITVLAAAGIGAVALARAGRRRPASPLAPVRPRRPEPAAPAGER
jgi:multicomponent Na+:H+ antiporter subunit A